MSALTDIYSKWTQAANEGETTAAILYDLSAAFDCVDSAVLCRKLKHYGFSAKATEWFRSYLTKQKQVTSVGSTMSRTADVLMGSPQGSLLLPVIFIILMGDIDLWTEHSFTFGFADDTSSSCSGDDFEEVLNNLEQDAEHILLFMASNCLVMNPEKTGFLVHRPNLQEFPPIHH